MNECCYAMCKTKLAIRSGMRDFWEFVIDLHIPFRIGCRSRGLRQKTNEAEAKTLEAEDEATTHEAEAEASFFGFEAEVRPRGLTSLVYVRPILEYCTCVWSPYLLKDIHKN